MGEPLARPIWSALSTRQRGLCLGDEASLRLRPEFGIFAAAREPTAEGGAAVARLIAPGQGVILFEAAPQPAPDPDLAVQVEDAVLMVASGLSGADPPVALEPLGAGDAPQMLALARLTNPGPFFERTHQLGGFIGVKAGGRLLAMAGERLKPEGFTEVSGVCTHPQARGRGYASALIRAVAARIEARGETPFLHTFAHNAGAIRLYEALGFRLERRLKVTIWSRPGAAPD